MIVYERQNSYLLFGQHDHARVSGEIAFHWCEDYFPGVELKDKVVLAVYEHDRGWIPLDADPLWNEKQGRPYSFMDYPAAPKIHCYNKGVEEVVKQSPYAGLLCSLHYTSFLKGASEPAALYFLEEEHKRQELLLGKLGIAGNPGEEQKLRDHLDILKFCDNLSLYICLNEPGTTKEKEHPFFRESFPQRFAFASNEPIAAQWISKLTVTLSNSPLSKKLKVQLPYKELEKEHIKVFGLKAAWQQAPVSTRTVYFVQKTNFRKFDALTL
jgi:hypothetical protein